MTVQIRANLEHDSITLVGASTAHWEEVITFAHHAYGIERTWRGRLFYGHSNELRPFSTSFGLWLLTEDEHYEFLWTAAECAAARRDLLVLAGLAAEDGLVRIADTLAAVAIGAGMILESSDYLTGS